MKGWVKIHRSILKSGTFKKLNLLQQLIALYIIINANHEDGVWHDKYKNISVPVKRGEQVVSIDKIIGWFDDDKEVTIAKVRKTLEKLIANGFITTRTTNNYTVINVVNYGIYQDKEEENNKQDNKEITKGKQRDDKGITTNKNDNNDNNDNNEKKEDDKELTVVAEAKPKRVSKSKNFDLSNFDYDKYNLYESEIDALKQFIFFRSEVRKKPLTENALNLIIKQVFRVMNDRSEFIPIIEQSIRSDWLDVFQLKDNKTKNKNSQSKIEMANAGRTHNMQNTLFLDGGL